MNIRKLIAFAAVAASAILPSWAATNITEDVTLTADADWRDRGQVTIGSGVTVALNGHRLFVSGTAGGGTVINQTGLYSHYRFKVEAIGSGTTLGFSDLRLFSYGVNVTAQRSGASGSNGGGSASSSQTYAAVLDNNTGNKWCAVGIKNFDTLWVRVDYAEPIMITKYEWWSTNDGAQRDRAPTKWRFQGSNDGTNWVDIDVVERAYEDNPATSKTLAYTYDNGLTEDPGTGEFHVDVPAGETAENTVALEGNVKFVKEGDGLLTETRSAQFHKGGDEIAAGTMAYAADGYVVPGDLALAGGTLAITDGKPLTASGAVSVSAPSTVKFVSSSPIGRKLLITGVGTGFDTDDLTLVVEPSVPGVGSFDVQDGDLYAAFGAADDVVLARWTGAVDGDVSKTGNWNCYNPVGTLLEDRLPTGITDVRVEGDVNIQLPVGTAIACAGFSIGDCTLATDCDWRGLPGSIDGTVALNGHRLTVADFVGGGTVINQTGLYSHYRFKVEAIGGNAILAFSDLRLFSYGVNVTAQRSGASGSNGGGSAANSSQTYAAVLDNNTGNKWCATKITNFDTLWVRVDYAEPIMITKYEWWSSNDGDLANRSPRKWRFQGSNDGTTWVDLDIVERTAADAPAESKILAYSKILANSYDTEPTEAPGTGEFRVDVPAGETAENATLAISGDVKVVKASEGVFVASKAGQTYTGGTDVTAGTLRPGVNSAGVFGNAGTTLAVADGAQILDTLAADSAFAGHYLQLEGDGPDGTGAYRVTVRKSYAYNYAWTRGLTLTGDTLFGRDDYGFGLIRDSNYAELPLTLNNHTLTFRSPVKATEQNATHLAISSVKSIGPGTLVISDYVKLYPKSGVESVLSEVTLVIEPLAEYFTGNETHGMNLTVSNLVYRSNSANSQTARTTTVYGCYKLESTASAPKVQLGDASHLSPTLDLSSCAGTFDTAFGGGLTFTEGSTVSVKMDGRNVPRKVIGWAEGTGPSNVTFVLADAQGKLEVRSDGVYCRRGFMLIVK